MKGCIVWVVCGLFLGLATAVLADVVPEDDSNPCPELPQGAIPIEYRNILTQVVSRGRPELSASAYETEDDFAFPAAVLYDRMVIGSEDEFRVLSSGLSTDINWDTSRILVVEEFASYKFDTLDRDVRLSGIYIFGESLIVSQTSTYYGPCQGVAQDSVGLSFDISYLLIAVPQEPTTISYHWCSVGDCPPDIP